MLRFPNSNFFFFLYENNAFQVFLFLCFSLVLSVRNKYPKKCTFFFLSHFKYTTPFNSVKLWKKKQFGSTSILMTLVDELLCSWCENFCAMNRMLSQQLCIRKCNNIVDIRRAYNEMPCWRLNLLYSYHFGIERVVVGHYCLANLCAYFRFTSHI